MTFDPGQFRERVRFETRAAEIDDYGNPVTGPFAPQFERAALYLMRPGSEAVLAARLSGRQPVTVIVSLDSQTKAVTTDWRLVDARTGVVYDIQALADMDRRRQWLSIVAEAGVVA